MTFELIHNEDILSAYGIICERIEDLKKKGIHRYERPYSPIEMFLKRQRSNENFGLYNGYYLVGEVTLIKDYVPEGWANDIKSKNFLWLTTLFIPLKYKGRNTGMIFLKEYMFMQLRKI